MYINPKLPGETKYSTSKPKPRYVQSQRIASFVVHSDRWFSLGTTHKFNVYHRDGHMVPEYCKPCSRVRKVLNIDGEEADYVQSALDAFEPVPSDDYDIKTFKQAFTALLINEYQRLTSNS